MFDKDERTALFIDGANLHGACGTLQITIDWKRLREYYAAQAKLQRVFYFTALLPENQHSPMRPLFDWLDYNGFHMVTKQTGSSTNAKGVETITGNMDVDIAVCALEYAQFVDHIVLFSGDGDFRYLIEKLQQKGKRVTVCSIMSRTSDDLRRQADNFINLEDMRPFFEKKRRS